MSEATSFAHIEAMHGGAPFGRVLDAGTGVRSLRWLTTVETEAWTAVTGTRGMAARAQRVLGERFRPQDRLVVGNWADEKFLAGETYDIVLADHLLGAIEGFAPYFQTSLFERLRALTGKRLYVTGMEPYVVERPSDEAGALMWEIGRFRDACLLLAGQKPYREFPRDWVLAELRRSGFAPVAGQRLAVGYKAYFVNSQLDSAKAAAERLADKALANAMVAHGEALRARGLAHIERHGPLAHAHYVIAAEPA
jgi:hypothetical protein